MKKIAICLIALATAAVAVAQDKPAAPAPEKKLKLENIAWLSGCWKGAENPRHSTFEHWTKPVGNMLLGMGTTVTNGKVSAYEYMRIEARDDGNLVFTAKPHNQSEATFTLTSSDADNLIFENPEHDFPQRVIYRRGKDDSLEARIDGVKDGHRRAALFPMAKTACK
jgi:hypothetical protein